MGFGAYAGGVLFILLFYLCSTSHFELLDILLFNNDYKRGSCKDDSPVYNLYTMESEVVTVSTLIPYYSSPSFFVVLFFDDDSVIFSAGYIQIPKNIIDKRLHKYNTIKFR